jgi:acyl-coenzyme A thioesterase PaaI-like protein
VGSVGDEPSLQDRFAPGDRCFGCGPANEKGLRLKSRLHGDEVVAEWTPDAHHEAFPGVLNGGIIGALLDCHGNWTAAWHFMARDGLEKPPTTVTAEFHVRLRKPTPSKAPVRLRAHVAESSGRRATVDATLESGGEVTATCHGVFVAVRDSHVAARRR